MHWQDIVLAAGSFVFAVALIPTVLSKEKPPLSTSLLTGITLLVFAVVYATLSLWLSFFSTCITAALWLTIAAQRLIKV